MKTQYDVKEIELLMRELGDVFDIVRLVDPLCTSLISFKNGELQYDPYVCYHVWKKNIRCSNCSSLRAINTNTRKTKYEFIDDDVYYIVSIPLKVIDDAGKTYGLVLEIVSNVTDEVMFEAFGKNDFIDTINKSNKKMYEDSLTGLYNRRYYNEYMYLNNLLQNPLSKITLIVADIKAFKKINDIHGHMVGDIVLKKMAQVFKHNLKKGDMAIRMGGDEFLIILKNSTGEQARATIQKFKDEIDKCEYDINNNFKARCNYGFAEYEGTDYSPENMNLILTKADEAMYFDKNSDHLDS